MSPVTRYCNACGRPAVRRLLEGRMRSVCSACGTVLYENPLPVAASILLDHRRRVLLVRRARPPYQGEWCLPMGFAELGETIAEAAIRELEEETGVEARVTGLVDADSFASDDYGELLIVTFEMRATGGTERAGDDAEALRRFPIVDLPPLAFSSNSKALRACAASHLEAWEIQDSFATLQADTAKALLSDDLVELIRVSADEIAGLWLEDVRGNPTTTSYRKLPPDDLRERACQAVSQFGRWFKGTDRPGEVPSFYSLLAEERAAQGFGVHEVVSSLTLLKKHVWTFARSQGVWDRPVDVYRVLELNRLMAAFFDRAVYHTVRAFPTA